MPAIVLYLIKLSCSLAIIWLFYRLVLHNLTFYSWNRWYLLGYAAISFLIPFIDIGPIRGEDPALQPLIVKYIPVIDRPVFPAVAPVLSHATHWDIWNVLLFMLALGSCFLLLRFLIRCYSLRNLRKRAALLQEGPISIYRIAEPVSPFSFGNAIYINTGQHSEKEWEEIILHEYVHIRGRHTLDILFGELLVILNWYNPFAWLIRYSIRQNLEFIADQAVIDNGVDKKGYQYHLLKVLGQTRYKLANNFNFSSLKKRIVMMNKLRSARLHLIRFMFILPLLSILLVAFRSRFEQHYINVAGIAISLPNKAPLGGVIVREKYTGLQTTTDANGYYKLKIPAGKESVDIHMDFTKSGYRTDYIERSWTSLQNSTGLCWVAAMPSLDDNDKEIFINAPDLTRTSSIDPGYKDAFHALQQVLKANIQINNYIALGKAHPEISFWYITEDKQRRLLVHTDGTVERYGYPGSPSLTDMDGKYGSLPDFMVKDDHPVNNGYLARWANISAQADREFHTTNPTAKAIIFPGDSRVIAIPASGKPQVYDMDNDDPKERPAFEALYGSLPACVPAPHSYPKPIIRDPRPTDTVPRKKDTLTTTKNSLFGNSVTNPDYHKALWVVDGVVRPQGYYNTLKQEDIVDMNVYGKEAAVRLFGKQGENGVFYVTTRANNHTTFRQDIPAPQSEPTVYVVDGLVVGYNALDSLDPNNIRMVTIPKQGVVVIQTKKPIWPHVVLETKDADGKPMKVIADSLHTPEGDIHAENNVPDPAHPDARASSLRIIPKPTPQTPN